MISLSFMVTAFGLGIAYAAAPGAVNTEAIRRGVASGTRSTLLVETGSLIGDSLWALLALTGVTFLAHYLVIQIVLGIAGAAFYCVWLGWLSLKHANASIPSRKTYPPHEGISRLVWFSV